MAEPHSTTRFGLASRTSWARRSALGRPTMYTVRSRQLFSTSSITAQTLSTGCFSPSGSAARASPSPQARVLVHNAAKKDQFVFTIRAPRSRPSAVHGHLDADLAGPVRHHSRLLAEHHVLPLDKAIVA